MTNKLLEKGPYVLTYHVINVDLYRVSNFQLTYRLISISAHGVLFQTSGR